MKNRKTVIASLAILGIVFITAGISYAVFSYSKSGIKGNSINSGNIVFHYGEGGRSVSLTDAMPMTDAQGKAQNNYFDFTITSKTNSAVKVPYKVTVKRKGNDSSLDSGIKLYLTEVNNNAETDLTLANNNVVSKYSELTTYTNTSLNITAAKNEKLLYEGEVPKNSNSYEKNYRLRMWVSDDYNFSQTVTGSCSDSTYTTRETCVAANKDWTDVATATEKTFTATVNVYAEGESVGRNLAQMIKTDNILRQNTPDFTIIDPAPVYSANFNGFENSYDMSNSQDNYITYSDSFTINPTTGRYTLNNPQICKWSECYNDLIGKYTNSTRGSSSNTMWATSDLYGIYKVTSNTTQNTLYSIYSDEDTTYDNTNSGFYSMNVTDGFGGANGTTYYFRGEVNNNYVQFGERQSDEYAGYHDTENYWKIYYPSLSACQNASDYNVNCTKVHSSGEYYTWRIVRINEDGTVRLILDNEITGGTYTFNSNSSTDNIGNMYYSNSDIKSNVESWYNSAISSADHAKVATGNYFCEAAKVKPSNDYTTGDATVLLGNGYIPNLKCETDGNNYGLLNNSVGLINYDEAVIAGGAYNTNNFDYYLRYKSDYWTMSPAGLDYSAEEWYIYSTGNIRNWAVRSSDRKIRPVINLKADVLATGSGTLSDPYIVQ